MSLLKGMSARHLLLPQGTNIVRYLSTSPKFLKASPHIKLFTGEGNDSAKCRQDTNENGSRPLVVLLPWIEASPSAVKKFVNVYLSYGFDVLTCQVSMSHALRPSLLNKAVRNELVPFLLSTNHSERVCHAFCVGGIVYAGILKELKESEENPFLKSIRVQIWDSLPNSTTYGLSVAQGIVPPAWKILENSVKRAAELYAKAIGFEKYFEESQQIFKNFPVQAPSLLLASEADEIGTVEINKDYKHLFEKQGISCELKIWKDSGHVQHMRMHPEEYWGTVTQFLKSNGFPELERRTNLL